VNVIAKHAPPNAQVNAKACPVDWRVDEDMVDLTGDGKDAQVNGERTPPAKKAVLAGWHEAVLRILASQEHMKSDFAVWFGDKDLKDLAISMAEARGVNGVSVLLNASQTPFTKHQMKTALPLVYKSERMLSKNVTPAVMNQNAKIAKDAIEGANDDAELVDLIERKAKKAPKRVCVKVVGGNPSKKSKTESAAAKIPEDSEDDEYSDVRVRKGRKRNEDRLASGDEGDE
jgi:hypothetical protein